MMRWIILLSSDDFHLPSGPITLNLKTNGFERSSAVCRTEIES